MAGSIYGIGVSALNTAQLGMTTTEHNIANANTDGYRRQQTVQVTNIPNFTGSGFIGNGVNVDTVKRIFSQYLDTQLLQTSAQSSQLNTYYSQMQQIDNMLADQTSGLSPSISSFFQGVNDFASNPSSVPARQSLLSTGQSLASRFNALNDQLTSLKSGVNTQVSSVVAEINSYSKQIANMNQQIIAAESSANPNQQANDLRDQRDQLVSQLNQDIKAQVITQSDGSYSVFIGNGQALVVGSSAYQLSAQPSLDNQQQTDVFYQPNASSSNVVPIKSSLLQGGVLGGLLAFRDQSLTPTQNALGRIGIALGQTLNDQNRLGVDLNGLPGGDIFKVATPNVLPNTANTGNGVVSASISDAGALTTSDYSLSFSGGQYTLVRLSDNTSTTISSFPATVDGVTLNLTGAPKANDRWLIQPTVNGARDLSVSLTDTSRLAAAAPMVTAAATANTGTGSISAGSVVPPKGNVTLTFTAANSFNVVDNTTGATIAGPVAFPTANGVIQYPAGTGWPVNITNPSAGDSFTINKSVITPGATNSAGVAIDPTVNNNVTITFTTATTFNVVDNTTGNNLAMGVPYNPANGATLTYNGWTANLTGTPAAGDVFTVTPNTNGTEDNRNALALAALQTANTMVNNASGTPTTTYLGAYAQMTSDVGNTTRELQVTSTAQSSLVSQVKTQQQSISGVNLDEEAANLIRYQQAYQAAGKMIQVATTMFDTLIGLGQ